MANEKILIIDDDPDVHEIFKARLGDAGYDVSSALSCDEALKLFDTEKFDLIFVDLVLPVKDGIETCKEIKEISPSSKLIFMTGYLNEDTIKREFEFGELGGITKYCLYKPFLSEELEVVTKKALAE